jgi:hypothetical protein
MIGHGAWMSCDQCKRRTIVTNNQSITALRKLGRSRGWVRSEIGMHWCPDCALTKQGGDAIDPAQMILPL